PAEAGACESTAVEAEVITVEVPYEVTETVTTYDPVALYIMQDISGSMITPSFPSLIPLWTIAQNAVNAFVADPTTAGLDVAIQYFPKDPQNCATGTPYDQPAVPIGRLPGHASAISTSINATAPFGSGTPIEAALRGATAFCLAFQAQNPLEKCVPVLITDGAPSGCNESFPAISDVAAQAAAQGVTTFAVGMSGANFTLLNDIAAQGGSDCNPQMAGAQACDVTAGTQAFTDALLLIRNAVTTTSTRTETRTETRETALECEWKIPPAPAGETFDRDKVNVKLSSGGQTVAELGRVQPGACAGFQRGWHYDDPAAPTKVVACPDSCELVKGTSGARIDIGLGCETVEAVVK
ncbi:MAG: VWA domain-containing protein, partial [Deltaproteobacteria bacterium]|nr:VWA domain-containing protein [Deltaproteobacteria bacterium]